MSGSWKDDVLEGTVEMQACDGTYFKGLYFCNRKNGHGKMISPNKGAWHLYHYRLE